MTLTAGEAAEPALAEPLDRRRHAQRQPRAVGGMNRARVWRIGANMLARSSAATWPGE
jgi:hypothetical protein